MWPVLDRKMPCRRQSIVKMGLPGRMYSSLPEEKVKSLSVIMSTRFSRLVSRGK